MTDSPEFVSTLSVQIERTVHPPSFRGTRYATFQRTDGVFLCEVYIEDLDSLLPRMQIRSSAYDLEVAAAVAIAIQMACEWVTAELGMLRAADQGWPEVRQ